MDLDFTPYQKKLKAEIEEFCREQLKKAPAGWETESHVAESDEGFAYHRSVVKAAAEQGFLNQAWPVEYGGKGHGPIEQLIYMETTGYHNVPATPIHYGQMAFMIMQHGTEEQRARWLPLMARAEITWTELFSEPNAGSDLASLTTSAVLDGDEYVMNGEKIWTSAAHRADHMFGLVRTDPNLPKHRGLTFFATKLGPPGIEFRPLLSMNNGHHVNRTYISDFRLPRTDIVGEVNRGWYTMQAGRNVARVNMIGIANLKRQLEQLTEFCKETSIGGRLLSKDPIIRQKLADYAVQLESDRRYAYYVCWLQSKGQDVAAEASACGFYWADCAQRLGELGMEVLGMYGPVQDGSRWTPLYGKFQDLTMANSSFSIAGGTTEIRKNVIAQRGLGLPRGS